MYPVASRIEIFISISLFLRYICFVVFVVVFVILVLVFFFVFFYTRSFDLHWLFLP